MPKVLVADDSIAVRKVAERLLTEAGLGVTLAANGEEALAFLTKETPDLIVSDVIMPDKSGYEVCAFVRSQKALSATPVLLISGIVNDEVAKQAESCKADGVLKKPFQGTSLKDRVLELLSKRHEPAPAPEKTPSKTASPPEVDQAARVSQEQLETYRKMAVQLKQAEEDLRKERDQTSKLGQKLSQLEGQLGRVKELESMLASGQEQAAQAKRSAEEVQQVKGRLKELEGKLASERELAVQAKRVAEELQFAKGRISELEVQLRAEQEQAAQLKKRASEMQDMAKRVQELEVALQKERDQVAQQAHRLGDLQRAADRAKEFESALHAERQAATQLVEQMNVMEKAVSRSQEMAQQFAREQQRSEELARRLSEVEGVVTKARELEGLLQTERDRNAVLTRHVSETEQSAQQATKRFEEMAKKLGEIAGLASQLGSGTRRS
jgi:DNA-binding response OmpR family regulator